MPLRLQFSRALSVSVSLAAALSVTGCVRPDGAAVTLPGHELFGACVACHGQEGQGNPTVAAPPIAGLPAWYVEAQLTKFRSGLRGYHPDDLEGLRMRPMSRQMMNTGEVTAVSEYVASLAPKKPAPSLGKGDATAGKNAYVACTACHGVDGMGNPALKAPPLANQADWYLASQLRKFKGGLRGTNPADVTGGQMRPMSMTLADEDAVLNVVAHIGTLTGNSAKATP